MAPILTVDTNCVYAVENGEADEALLELVRRGRQGSVVFFVPAIAASEKQPSGQPLGNFREFEARLAACGLGFARTVEPMAYIGMAFIGHALIIGPETRAQERAIHEVLFPKLPFDARDHCPSEDEQGRKRWRNAKCDVQAMWCHLHYGGDIFMTLDGNFHKETKRPELEALGAGHVATPMQALKLVDEWEQDREVGVEPV